MGETLLEYRRIICPGSRISLFRRLCTFILSLTDTNQEVAFLLLNPKLHDRPYPDEDSREIMRRTIDFFESKGKVKLKEDDRERVWYDDFLQFVRDNEIFYKLLTPDQYGESGCRWDTWRNCEFNEILAFYGLHYWYTWQVDTRPGAHLDEPE